MPATRKVSIYSEGIGNDVKVMNENGEILSGIYSANIVIEAGNIVTVELVIKGPSTSIQNAVVTSVELCCSLCGEVQEHSCS